MNEIMNKVQKFGKFLSGMVMPNIGAFIAWGLITALFIETGWFPNEELAQIVGPMLTYVLPLLIAYNGGGMVAGNQRGSIIAVIATIGVICGADIAMLIGAMAMGPFAGLVIKTFDKAVDGKIPTGFEMLVNNFSVGILGMILAIFGYYAIGPVIQGATGVLEGGVRVIVDLGILPLVSLFIEPAKVLFLNNAINHGILTPIGINDVENLGQSIMFLLESNPGPGLGVLLAYCVFGKGDSKESATGASIIHFFGGIQEIYFPYVLMNPILIIAPILGSSVGIFILSMFECGLVAAPSPGSILAILALVPSGGHLGVLLAVGASALVSFIVASPIVKSASAKDGGASLEEAQNQMKANKAQAKGEAAPVASASASAPTTKKITHIVFSCDAGMGSSAMGASRFRERIKALDTGIKVTNSSVDNIPADAQLVVTHQNLVERVKSKGIDIEIVSINNFLKDANIEALYTRLETTKGEPVAGGGASAPAGGAVGGQKDMKTVQHIVFSCDAGMGSSAMGASRFRERIKACNTGIKVTNSSVDTIPADAQIVVTHQNLVERVTSKGIDVEVVSISNFLKDANLDALFARVEEIKK